METESKPAAQPPVIRYFYKELISVGFIVGGAPVPFEPLDGNRGVLAIEIGGKPVMGGTMTNQSLVDALSKAAAEERGGIVAISADDYAKKKQDFPWRQRQVGSDLRVLPASPKFKLPSAPPLHVEGAAAVKVPPGVTGVPISAITGMGGESEATESKPAAPAFKPATVKVSKLSAPPAESKT